MAALPHLAQLLAKPRWLTGYLRDGQGLATPNARFPDGRAMGLAGVAAAAAGPDAHFRWSDFTWPRAMWPGAIVARRDCGQGILTGDDARRAADAGRPGPDRLQPRRPHGRWAGGQPEGPAGGGRRGWLQRGGVAGQRCPQRHGRDQGARPRRHSRPHWAALHAGAQPWRGRRSADAGDPGGRAAPSLAALGCAGSQSWGPT